MPVNIGNGSSGDAGFPTWHSAHNQSTLYESVLSGDIVDICFQCPLKCNECDRTGCTQYK